MHLVLAALSSPVPVIVRSMPPEVVKSLPPVAIRSMPGPDMFAALGIVAAVLAALFSGIAIRIALATLGKINEQISLAREELQAVKADFALSQEQFALSQRQFDEIMRRPKVVLSGKLHYAKVMSSGAMVWSFSLKVNLLNSGSRLAKSMMVEILVAEADGARFGGAASFGKNWSISTRDMSGTIYRVGSLTLPDLYPNEAVIERTLPLVMMSPDVAESTVLFRAYDENFAYPEKGYATIMYERQP